MHEMQGQMLCNLIALTPTSLLSPYRSPDFFLRFADLVHRGHFLPRLPRGFLPPES